MTQEVPPATQEQDSPSRAQALLEAFKSPELHAQAKDTFVRYGRPAVGAVLRGAANELGFIETTNAGDTKVKPGAILRTAGAVYAAPQVAGKLAAVDAAQGAKSGMEQHLGQSIDAGLHREFMEDIRGVVATGREAYQNALGVQPQQPVEAYPMPPAHEQSATKAA